MNTSTQNIFRIAAGILGVLACSSQKAVVPDGGLPNDAASDAGSDTGPTAASDACPATPTQAVPPEVPIVHRATAVACNPKTDANSSSDGGGALCATDADCMGDASVAVLFNYCLGGRCSVDQCLTDSDCPTGNACTCSADYYGGNGVHRNMCVPANCHLDSDCGAGGYCSPSIGHCGAYSGFYCHGPSDTCINSTIDCAGCGLASTCVYTPTVGAFVCGQDICGG